MKNHKTKNNQTEKLKVLVLGGAGYIGSVLCQYLKDKGDEVVILDNLLYEKGKQIEGDFEFIHGDICNTSDILPAIEEADAVVNLAAISNDPASDLSPNLTWEINYKANEKVAQLCKLMKKRVVYASSCSVYGFAEKGVFSERSKLNPVTLYARTKMLSEKYFRDKELDAVVLRLATVYGDSPKPRFDLVVNTMIGTAYFEGKIEVNGGEQWRPVVHVKDVAHAFYLALHAKNLKHRVFNVGSSEQNFKISQLGRALSAHIPGVDFVHMLSNVDKRSYLVDFSRISKELGFKCRYGLGDAVSEIYETFKSGKIVDLADDVYFRVKYLKKRINNESFRKRVFIHRINL